MAQFLRELPYAALITYFREKTNIMRTKFYLLIIALIVSIGVVRAQGTAWNAIASNDDIPITPIPPGNWGSSTNPFVINDAADLKKLADVVNRQGSFSSTSHGVPNSLPGVYFKLTADIDFNDVLSLGTWTPIGRWHDNNASLSDAFRGHFDGQGHLIYNINVTGYNTQNNFHYSGLFGMVTAGSIRNLGVEGKVTLSGLHPSRVGLLTAVLEDATIENCYAIGEINYVGTASTSSNSQDIGLLVGYSTRLSSAAYIKNCYAVGTVNVNYTGTGTASYHHVGGLVGRSSNSYIQNSYADVNVNTSNIPASRVGTLAGSASGSVTDCYANGSNTVAGTTHSDVTSLSNIDNKLGNINSGGAGPWVIPGAEGNYPYLKTTTGSDEFNNFIETTLKLNGGLLGGTTVQATIKTNDGNKINIPNLLALTPPTGYNAKGWYTGASDSYSLFSGTTTSSDITLTARYSKNVTLNYLNGTYGPQPSPFEIYYDEEPALPTGHTPANYTFGGWCINSNCSDASPYVSGPFTKDLSGNNLYAKYTGEISLYYYDSSYSEEKKDVIYNQPLASSDLPDLSLKKPTGYNDGTWQVGGITGSNFVPFTNFTQDPATYALYAKYTASLALDADGGALDAGGTSPQTITYNTPLSFNDPTKADYTFAGWKLSDGSSTVYTKGGDNFVELLTGTSELVAQWTPNPAVIVDHPEDETVCWGDSHTFTVNATGAGLTYQWNKGGVPIASASSSTYSTNEAGVYTVDVTGAGGTLTSNPATLTVKSVPSATIIGEEIVFATETGVVYTAGSGTAYSWAVTGGTKVAGGSATDNTITIDWGVAGSGTVEVTYIDDTEGCPTDKKVLAITISAQGTPDLISPVTNICFGKSQVYNTQTGKFNYKWTVTGGGTINGPDDESTVSVDWGAAGSGTIKVEYSEVASATPVVSLVTNVTINDKPSIAAISAPTGVCDGTPLTLTAPTVTSALTVDSEGWFLDGIAFTSGTNVAFAQHDDDLYYEAKNACGTIQSNTVKITVNELPTISTTDAAICKAGSIDLAGTVTNTGGHPTLLYYESATGGTALASSIVSPAVTTTYHVEVTSADGCVSASREPVVITVKAVPSASIIGALVVYATETGVVYTAGSGTAYSWAVTGGTKVAGGSATDNTITIDWGAVGTGTVEVSYVDAATGCQTDTKILDITISPQGTPIIINPAVTPCFDTNASYTTQTDKFNYKWTVTGGGTINGPDDESTVSVDWGAAGSGTIKVEYSEIAAATAISSAVTSITINDRPTVGALTVPAVCDGSPLILTPPSVTATPGATGSWTLSGSAFASGSLVTFAQNGESLYYSATNTCGTTDSSPEAIIVNQLPTVLTTAQTICPGGNVELNNAVANPSLYTLSFFAVETGGTVLASSDVTPTSSSSTYYVSALDANSCVSKPRIAIAVGWKTVTAITVQPVSPGIVGVGSPFSLSVTAVGETLTYQWYLDNVLISGATSATYSIASTAIADYGNYHVVVSGECGTPQTSETVIVSPKSPDATLSDLKVNGNTVPGFNPAVTTYVYILDCDVEIADIVGTPNFPGATVVNLLNQNLVPGDNHYVLTVTAENGYTTKDYYVNVVRNCNAPRILRDLSDMVVCEDSIFTLSVEVDGGSELTYEWYYGNDRIWSATGPTYTVNAAEYRDYEYYQVIIRSSYNGFKSSTYSRKARVWVASHLPNTLKFFEYPNPATTGKTYHLQLAGYIDITKYTWSFSKEGAVFSPEVTPATENETWVNFGPLAYGTGTLRVDIEHPCGPRVVTQVIDVKYPTGVDDVTAEIVKVYPNPTSGILKVSGTKANETIKVTDVTGSLKGTYKSQEGTTTISLTGYARGTYLVQYKGNSYKVIKN